MAPLKVRGKRSAKPEEKWDYGKQRKTALLSTPSTRSSSVVSSASDSKSPKSQQIKSNGLHLSRLEELPTEIVQTIFRLSMNPDLPVASPRLASQLASKHLQHELTDSIMYPLIRGRECNKRELRNATRLMESKFFTWGFFTSWLRAEYEKEPIVQDPSDPTPPPGDEMAEEWIKEMWLSLQPNPSLLPPKKVIRGPFNEEKVSYLFVLTDLNNSWPDPDFMDPLFAELAQEGLEQAVTEGAAGAILCFWNLGLLSSTQLLKRAVFDGGCNRNVVSNIMRKSPWHINFLDTELWAWADKASKRGDERGSWLISELKAASRTR